MKVLDCGCGPGSIAADVGSVVGKVVGVDIDEHAVALARELAARRGLDKATFLVGSADALPFPPDTFDVAFAHMLLFHVGDPLRVVREMHRVVRPGGLVALRDRDYDGTLVWPSTGEVREAVDLIGEWLLVAGSSPRYAKSQRALLYDVGCSQAESRVDVVGGGSYAAVRGFADHEVARLRGEEFQEWAIGRGFATHARIEELCARLHAWASAPSSFCMVTVCSAIGRV